MKREGVPARVSGNITISERKSSATRQQQTAASSSILNLSLQGFFKPSFTVRKISIMQPMQDMKQRNSKKELRDPIFPAVEDYYIEHIHHDYEKQHAGEESEAGMSPKGFTFNFLYSDFNIKVQEEYKQFKRFHNLRLNKFFILESIGVAPVARTPEAVYSGVFSLNSSVSISILRSFTDTI
jgi:hypothetical protein